MTTSSLASTTGEGAGRWSWPIPRQHFDTTGVVRRDEVRAIHELGVRNLRRLQYHDPSAPGWQMIGRLLGPLEAVNASLDSPPTSHRRRAMLDVIAVLLTRCAETGRTFWPGPRRNGCICSAALRLSSAITRRPGPETKSAPILRRTSTYSGPWGLTLL